MCAKNTNPTRIHHLRALLLDPLTALTALCYLGVTVIMELECSLAETDRARSRGMVSMAIASASE